MARVVNLFVDQGSDYISAITAFDDDRLPINLEDHVVRSQMRKYHGAYLSYDFETDIVDPSQGTINLILTASQSDSIPSGRYLYDVEITSPNGAKKRIVEGIVTLTPQITQT